MQSRLELYGYAVDSLRWELFDEIFLADDMHIRHGDRDPGMDLEVMKQGFDAIHRVFDSTRHSMSNFVFEIHGDVAHTVTYAQWRLVRRGALGGDYWYAEGWYEDEWVRASAGWRIRRRQSRATWGEGNPNVGTDSGAAPFELQICSLYQSEQAGHRRLHGRTQSSNAD